MIPAALVCQYISAGDAARAAGQPVTAHVTDTPQQPIYLFGNLSDSYDCEFDGKLGGGYFQYESWVSLQVSAPSPNARATFAEIRKSADAEVAQNPSDLRVLVFQGIGTDNFVVPAAQEQPPTMFILSSDRIFKIELWRVDTDPISKNTLPALKVLGATVVANAH